MTELELIIDFQKDLDRQGPGSVNDTLKAFNFVDFPNDKDLRIADIGCGTGGQTFTLAKNFNAEITAIDLFPGFLEKLNENAQKLGISNKISTLARSMDDLNFKNEELDFILSEGAI